MRPSDFVVHNGWTLGQQKVEARILGALGLVAADKVVVGLTTRVRAIASMPARFRTQPGEGADAKDEFGLGQLLQEGRADRAVLRSLAQAAIAHGLGERRDPIAHIDRERVLRDRGWRRRRALRVKEARGGAARRRRWCRGGSDHEDAVGELGLARFKTGVHSCRRRGRGRADENAAEFALSVDQFFTPVGNPVGRDGATGGVGRRGPEREDAFLTRPRNHEPRLERRPRPGQAASARCAWVGQLGRNRGGVGVGQNPLRTHEDRKCRILAGVGVVRCIVCRFERV